MNKPQSLYIHIPFCSSVCDYCDFCKLQYFRIIAEKYIKALIKEIDSYKINEPLKTIYIGGGTPTSLDDDLFEQLLKYLDKYANDVIEYTVEANPESLSNSKLKLMKEHGVNRLSIGWQTTNNEILKDIGRKHTYEQALDAFKRARDFGFNNINIISAPDPYIGSHGPNIVPRFTNLPSDITCNNTSQVHPIKENIKNIKI